MTRRRRFTFPVAVAAIMLAGLLPAYGLPGAAAGAGCAHVRTHNGWSTIDLPGFPPLPGNVSVTGTPQFVEANGVLFSTNGRVVMRSVTGGCSWQQVFTLDSQGYGTSVADDEARADPANAIQSMAVLAGATGRTANTIYLGVADSVSTFAFVVATPVYVYVSHDDGATWSTARMPLAMPTADSPSSGGLGTSAQVRVVASAAAPARVYVATTGAVLSAFTDPNEGHREEESLPAMAAPTFGLFTSKDSGLSWRHPAPNGLPNGNGDYYAGLFANPAVSGTLYLTTTATGSTLGNAIAVYRSTDGGESWRHLTDIAGTTWSTTPRVGTGGRAILISSGATAYLTLDGGRTWKTIAEPIVVGGGWSLGYGNAFLAGPHHTLVDVLDFNNESLTGTKRVTMWQAYEPAQRTWKRLSNPMADTGLPKSKPKPPDSYYWGSWYEAPGGAAIDLTVWIDGKYYFLRHAGPLK